MRDLRSDASRGGKEGITHPMAGPRQDVPAQKGVNSPLFYGYVVTASGFLIWAIGWGTYTTCFGVFLKPMLAEFGWTRAEASLAYSISFLVQAAMGICAGWLNDRLGPRIVVVFLGSFLGLCYMLMSEISALWQFQINYAVMGGIGTSVLTVPVMATLSRWFMKRRGLMIGIVQAGIGVGGAFFAPFAGWLILAHSWRTAYFVIGLMTLSGMIVSGLLLKGDPKDVGGLPDGEMVSGTPRTIIQRTTPTWTQGLSFWAIVRSGSFWMLAGMYGSFGFCRSAFTPHMAAHVQDLGFSLVDGANVVALLAGSSMIGRIGMGRLGDLIGNRSTLTMSFAATAVILMWGLMAESLWGLYLFAVVFGFGWGAQAVLRFSVATEVFGLTSLGFVIGLLHFSEALIAAFASYIAGYIFDLAGNYYPVFWIGIAVSIAGTILAWVLRPPRSSGQAP